ncbi:MAG: ubiquinone/menaquinone biosynthesis methyltransferase [Ilumatobacteraceae bacterium]
MARKSSIQRSWDSDALPQGVAKASAVREMFDSIAPRYDLVNRIMTFRMDVRWRRRTVRSLSIPLGNCVLDLASGTGDLCVELRKNGFNPISVDVSLGMLQADHSGSPRVQADILRLPFADRSVDGVTCGFALRNLVDLPIFFGEVARVTRVGGQIALLDVSVPGNRLIRFGNSFYFGKVVPRIGGLLSNRAAYNYLPRSVAYLPSAEKLSAMLVDVGFAEVEHHQLSGGLTQLLLGTRS